MRPSWPGADAPGLPEGDDKTTWVPSGESMDPGEVTSWISGGGDLPDFERTEARGGRRAPSADLRPAPPEPDPEPSSPLSAPGHYEGTALIRAPRRRAPTPEPVARREARLPTPEPAPRRRERTQPTPAPMPPRGVTPTPSHRPPTPEPAPPRRGDPTPPPRAGTPLPGHTPMPPPPRAPTPWPGAASRPPPPPVPQPPGVFPDHWTPAPSEEPRQIYGADERSTEVNEDPGSGGRFDEVPPTRNPLPQIPNDAPTVVRPDLAYFPEPELPPAQPEQTVGGRATKPSEEETRALPPQFEYREEPPGEPTVALPPPSQRRQATERARTPAPADRERTPEPLRSPAPADRARTPAPADRASRPPGRDPTPEPSGASEALPGSAVYSPPSETVELPSKPKKSLDQQPTAKAPSAPKAVKKPPPPSGKVSAAPKVNKTGASKLPKGAEVSASGSESPLGAIRPIHLIYGSMFAAGVLLVGAAFLIGLLVLVFSG